MKIVIIALILSSFNLYAKTDWKTTYDSIKDKEKRLVLTDYIEACEDKVDNACRDGWRIIIKNIRKNEINDSFAEVLHLSYLNNIKEYCESEKVLFCAQGIDALSSELNILGNKLKNKKKELDKQEAYLSGLGDKANALEKKSFADLLKTTKAMEERFSTSSNTLEKYGFQSCQKCFVKSWKNNYCENLMNSNNANLDKMLTFLKNECINKKEVEVCDAGFKVASLFLKKDDYLRNVCVDKLIREQAVCNPIIQQEQKILQDEKNTLLIRIGLFLFVIAVGVYFIRKSKCPECKKYFAFEKTNSELFNSVQSENTKSVQVGETKDTTGKVVATQHQDMKYKITTNYYTDTYRCRHCGFSYTEDRIETKE